TRSKRDWSSDVCSSDLAFSEFKEIWDPDWQLNPGKAVRPYDPTDNLRMGPDARLKPVSTHFSFHDDDGDFGKAVSRCVGVGACRSEERRVGRACSLRGG